MEIEHVKAHRSKKERQQMSLFERLITEGNEKADELAKEGAMLDGGDVGAGENYHDSAGTGGGLCSFHCLVEACMERL